MQAPLPCIYMSKIAVRAKKRFAMDHLLPFQHGMELELKDFYFETHDKRHLTQEKRRYQYRSFEEGGCSTGLKKSSRLHIFQAHWVFSIV